jgi:hypothetical protein
MNASFDFQAARVNRARALQQHSKAIRDVQQAPALSPHEKAAATRSIERALAHSIVQTLSAYNHKGSRHVGTPTEYF